MSTCVGFFLFSGKPLHNLHAQALLELGVLSTWQTGCWFQLSRVCKHQPVSLACVDPWLPGNRVYTRLSWICNTGEQTGHAQVKTLLTYGSWYIYQIVYFSLLCVRKFRTKTEFQTEIGSIWVGASLALGHYQRWDCLKLGSPASQSVPEQCGQSDTPVSYGALGGCCFFLFPLVLSSAVSAELCFLCCGWMGNFHFEDSGT